MSNVKRFFSYSPDGFVLHETVEEAKDEAEAALSLWTDGEFTEGYLDICWGEVRGAVHEEILHHHGPECRGENGCPEGHYGASEYDYVGHCTLVDLPPDPDPEAERDALCAEVARLRAAIQGALNELPALVCESVYGHEEDMAAVRADLERALGGAE